MSTTQTAPYPPRAAGQSRTRLALGNEEMWRTRWAAMLDAGSRQAGRQKGPAYPGSPPRARVRSTGPSPKISAVEVSMSKKCKGKGRKG